jgi:hypothetical protein
MTTSPTDRAAFEAQIEAEAHRMCWRYKHSSDPAHSSTYTFNRTCLMDFAERIANAATAAERERAANVAENYPRADGWIAEEIAAAIRSGA